MKKIIISDLLISFFSWLAYYEQKLYWWKQYNDYVIGDIGICALIRDFILLSTGGMYKLSQYYYSKYPNCRRPIRFYLMIYQSFLIRDPRDVVVLSDPKVHNIVGLPLIVDRMRKYMGYNMITAEPHRWKETRTRTLPFIMGRNLRSYEKDILQILNDTVIPKWKESSQIGQPVNVNDTFTQYSVRVPFQVLLGSSDPIPDYIIRSFLSIFNMFREVLMSPITYPLTWPTPFNRRYIKEMNNIIEYIRPRIANEKHRNTLFGSIIRSHTTRKSIPFEQFKSFILNLFSIKEDDIELEKLRHEYDELTNLETPMDVYHLANTLISKMNIDRLSEIGKVNYERDDLRVKIENFFCRDGTINETNVCQEIIGDMIGASETTGTTMMFSCYYLATYPEIQQKLRKEIIQADEEGLPMEEQINRGYLGCFINEVLRIGSPAKEYYKRLGTDVILTSEDGLTKTKLPKDTLIHVSTYFMQRDSQYWEDSLTFNPDRWLSKKTSSNSNEKREFPIPGTFNPFSIGARRCPGDQYAKREVAYVIATLVKSFNIRLSSSEFQIEFDTTLNLRPKNNILIRLNSL
jgi:cytochrome P450